MNEEPAELAQVLEAYVGRQVVLDTAGPIVYLGNLKEVNEAGFWIENADIHDSREGHAGKELYIYESKVGGVRSNRKRVFVMRSTVISLSALDEVVHEDLDPQRG